MQHNTVNILDGSKKKLCGLFNFDADPNFDNSKV